METPDFDDLARDLMEIATEGIKFESREMSAQRIRISDQLRQVWNARGAADAEAILKLLPYRSDIGDRAFENGMNEGIGEAASAIKALDELTDGAAR